MPDLLTIQDVLKRGATYRQIDHWARQGWIRPIHRGGTGHNREWPQTELQIADLMRRLLCAGLTVDVAALVARTAIERQPLVKLAPGITLAIDTDLLTKVTP
jgi:DNA-binding transcriptional MerR regulator